MMISSLRWVRYLSVVALVCLLLSFFALSVHAPAAVHEGISSLKATSPSHPDSDDVSPRPVSSKPESVLQLWQFWSKAFEDARPDVPKIRLSSNAAHVPVADDDFSLRSPDHNRVSSDKSHIASLQSAHAKFVESMDSHWDANGSSVFNGTGVVVVGGGEYFGPAIVGLHMLRKSGSTLPVEIFVATSEEYEKDLCEQYLPLLGAKCLIITDYLDAGQGIRALRARRSLNSRVRSREKDSARNRKNGFEVTHYQLKSLAMLFCSFAHVLYLDSDSIPLVDPATDMFPHEPYTTTGLVIWPDFWQATESPLFWSIAGFPAYPEGVLPKSSSEAGQLLINKHTHLKTLLLANYYNIYGPAYYYPLLSQGALGQGDKETFLAAATVLGQPWYRVRKHVQSVSRQSGGLEKGSGMIQYHPFDDFRGSVAAVSQPQQTEERKSEGRNSTVREMSPDEAIVRPAFLHANTPKMNAGHLVNEGDLIDSSTEAHIRVWGPRDNLIYKFGFDVEKIVWEILVATGCALQSKIAEWKERHNLCEDAQQHFTAVFGGTSVSGVAGVGGNLRWRKKGP